MAWFRVPLRGSAVAVVWDLCFWFPGCTDRTVASLFWGWCVWGVWYGVVV